MGFWKDMFFGTEARISCGYKPKDTINDSPARNSVPLPSTPRSGDLRIVELNSGEFVLQKCEWKSHIKGRSGSYWWVNLKHSSDVNWLIKRKAEIIIERKTQSDALEAQIHAGEVKRIIEE